MRVALLTREYPPEVYGGAGVHVEYLARELSQLEQVTVHAGAPAMCVTTPWDALAGDEPSLAALQALSIDLTMAARTADAELVHSHTWYANLGGHLAKLVHGIPHVATVHSLEPLRPWKAEQLGGGYAVSSFAERTALEGADAVIAVSKAPARTSLRVYPAIDPERVHVIHNGIDTAQYSPDPRHRRARALRRRPGAAVGGVRRPDHAAEGGRAPPARRARLRPRGPARPVRRLRRHAGDRRRGRAPRR